MENHGDTMNKTGVDTCNSDDGEQNDEENWGLLRFIHIDEGNHQQQGGHDEEDENIRKNIS